jgi:sterol desaturase/sphingolipid hydroxylase (fatty acid hydroxylase superfamily)
VLIGTSPAAFSTLQFLFLLSILFHHSEVELPIAIERRLAWLFVTPRMHGIYHSTDPAERNSNWSSGLSLWDRLHLSALGTVNSIDPRFATASFSFAALSACAFSASS